MTGLGLSASDPVVTLSTVNTADDKSGTDKTACCRASRDASGTDTSIMSEKYDAPNRPATDSPTLPPCAITSPVTSLTMPNRSRPAALMIKCDVVWAPPLPPVMGTEAGDVPRYDRESTVLHRPDATVWLRSHEEKA
jgi:hypothetical protein